MVESSNLVQAQIAVLCSHRSAAIRLRKTDRRVFLSPLLPFVSELFNVNSVARTQILFSQFRAFTPR